jgi:hypothetical protein
MTNYILLIIIMVCGLALTLAIGTVKNMPNAPAWSRKAVRIAGSCAILWSVLKTIQMTHIVMHNTAAGRLLQIYKVFFGGMVVGILITVFMSGAFDKKSRRTWGQEGHGEGHGDRS